MQPHKIDVPSTSEDSAHVTSWDLKFAKFVKQFQVLSHGVDRVRGCKESFWLGSKNRWQFWDAGAEEGLHELLHEIPAVAWNHTGAVLHLKEHSRSYKAVSLKKEARSNNPLMTYLY